MMKFGKSRLGLKKKRYFEYHSAKSSHFTDAFAEKLPTRRLKNPR